MVSKNCINFEFSRLNSFFCNHDFWLMDWNILDIFGTKIEILIHFWREKNSSFISIRVEFLETKNEKSLNFHAKTKKKIK